MTTTDRPTVLVMGSHETKVRAAGGKAKAAPHDLDALSRVLDAGEFDGLLLLGGGDVNPALYGQTAHPSVYGVSDYRDFTEFYAVDAARDLGVPIMGICRGAQVMAVSAGGTLHQNIEDSPTTGTYHAHSMAPVNAVRGSRLAKAWANGQELCQHLHHQAVDRLPVGWVATGFAKDGTVEAIESVEGWELGVQFHPEMVSHPSQQGIFDAFLGACSEFSGLPLVKPQPVPVRRSTAPVSDVQRHWGRLACGQCGIVFDDTLDYVDHHVMFHGQDREQMMAW